MTLNASHVFSVSISSVYAAARDARDACPCFLHLGVAVDSNAPFYVLLLPTGLKQCLLCELVGLSLRLQRGWGR